MDLPEINITTQYTRIPKAFRSSETGKFFSNCIMCNKYLLQEGTGYIIEKAIKQHPEVGVKEVIFEYAMCFECSITMNAALSEESRQRINAYLQQHANFVSRRNTLLGKKSLRVQPWINKCLIKNTPISASGEYQIIAQCDGKHLLFTYMPFALSMEALNEMTALMSAKSLGEIDDFIGKYFSGPPEVAELLRKRSLVLI